MSLEIDAVVEARELLEPWLSVDYAQTPELVEYVNTHAVAAPLLARGIFWYEEDKGDYEAAMKEFMVEGWDVDEAISPFAAFSEEVSVAREFADAAVYGLVLVVEGLRGVSVLGMLEESGLAGVNVKKEKEWLVPSGQQVKFDRVEGTDEMRFLYGRVVEPVREVLD
jgi:hypothetical protein